LITESAVMNEAKVDFETAQCICQNSRQLFGILAYMKRGSDIVAFMADGITDEHLPFRRIVEDGRPFYMEGKEHENIRILQNWDGHTRKKFCKAQRLMTAPFFECGEHYEFDDNTVLPFIDIPSGEAEVTEHRGGGYSEIQIRRIHPAHHNFWDSTQPGVCLLHMLSDILSLILEQNSNLVAIKKLISPDEDEFKKEETILRRLAPKKHPHLLELLATFRQTKSQEVKWHLIFPCADANLRAYWEKHEPDPDFNDKTIIWTLKQMSGIADGLKQVHICTVTYALSPQGAGNVRVQGDATMSVKKGEQWFGRHGDIKPENILWFRNDPDHKDNNGLLKIADFGLGRFHGLDSRSKVPPDSVWGTSTYEPPELKLGIPVSRAYDIWSLGCLYLEFVTWLLMGATAVEAFANCRAESWHTIPSITDSFYTIIRAPDGKAEYAMVRQGMETWVLRLHQNESCSELLHELLNLVMEKMLVIDREGRTSATNLQTSFENLRMKVEKDITYATRPAPWATDEEVVAPDAEERSSPKVRFSGTA
jgi:serine/threonine protein kinase